MKILVVNDTFNLGGGAEKYAVSLVNELKALGHAVDTYEYRPISTKINFFLTPFNPLVFMKFLKYLKNHPPDIIHINNFSRVLSSSVIGASKIRKIPVVWTAHDFEIICPKLSFVRKDGKRCEGYSLQCLVSNCATARKGLTSRFYYIFQFVKVTINRFIIRSSNVNIISPNKELANCLIIHLYPKYVVRIPNFIKISKLPQKIDTPDENYLLCVGTLSEGKGFDLAIKALDYLIKEEKLDMNLIIVGDGHYKEQLLQLAQNLHLESRVHLVGRKDGKDLDDLYDHCAMVLIPSRFSESFPLVALESMNHRKPIVASNVRALVEIIDGQNGLLFNNDDYISLAFQIKALFRDTQRRKEMGEYGFSLVIHEYSPRHHMDKIIEMYEKVIHG